MANRGDGVTDRLMRAIRGVVVALACAIGATLATPAVAGCVDGGPAAAAMNLYVPAQVATRGPAPLLVLLHGSTGTGAAMLRDSGLARTADRHGFVVAAPDGGIAAGRGFIWNIPGVQTVTGAMPGARDRDDVAFLLRGVDALVRAGCVDPHRVYVTGLSGGGRMTSWLGCVAADRIAAIAPVVGLRAGRPLRTAPDRPDPATCRPARAEPVMAFAGDADTTNPIAGGGAPYWRYAMDAAMQRWAQINRCTAVGATRWLTARVYEVHYNECRDGAEVVARITRGGPHAWSVADNEAMWTFLSRFRR